MSATAENRTKTPKGFKPRIVEEPIDWYFHRPLAAQLVKLLLPLPVTPDQVTFASGTVGLLSGGVFALAIYGSQWWVVVAGFVLLLSIMLDCADGQIARIRGTSSVVGRILDGTVDIVAVFSILHGMGFYLLLREGFSFWLIWPIGIAMAWSLAYHSAQYDAMKNLYLHCSRPDFSIGGRTLLTEQDLKQYRAEFADKGERFNVFLMNVWIRWTATQRAALKPWTGSLSPRNEAERQLYCELFNDNMTYWTWIGFGTHLFILTVICWLTPLSPWAIWIGWGIILGPMNLWCLWLMLRRPKLEKRYRRQLRVLRRHELAEDDQAPTSSP